MATKLSILNELLFIPSGNTPEFAEALAQYYSKKGGSGFQWLNTEADPEWERYTREYFAEHKDQLLAELQYMSSTQPLQDKIRNLNSSASFRLNKFFQEHKAYEAAEALANKKVDLYRMGLEWWPRTYAKASNYQGAAQAVLDLAETLNPELREHFKDLMFSTVMRASILAPACWADQGFPVIQFGSHNYATALMVTMVPEVVIHPPWKAFLLELPTDLLFTTNLDGSKSPITHTLVHYHELMRDDYVTITEGWTLFSYTKGSTVLHSIGHTLEQLREGSSNNASQDPFPDALRYETTKTDERTILLIKRLVLNTCLAMSDPSSVRLMGKHPSGSRTGPRRMSKEPTYRVFRVGKPIKLDFRQAVRDYIAGTRSGVTVQFLVRGHWRNQACGPKMADHRMIWIEPYWKGPEDAPINVRSHVTR